MAREKNLRKDNEHANNNWAQVGKVLTIISVLVGIAVGVKTLIPEKGASLVFEGSANLFFDPPDDMGNLDQAFVRTIRRSGGMLFGTIANRGSKPAKDVEFVVPFGTVGLQCSV